MSHPTIVPDKIRENRLKYVEALESGKYEQVFDFYFMGSMNACATGVAIIEMGYRNTGRFIAEAEDLAMTDLGGDEALIQTIVNWNDRERLTFLEIAEKLRLLWDL